MAVYYWVGGSGDWQNPAKWSTSSGGPGGSVVPLDTDDMIFDTNSSGGSYIVEAFGMACKNLTAVAPASGTLTFNDARIFVRGGNFSSYSGCLWTASISFCSVDQSSDNTGVPRTYSADFGSSGTRTSIVSYSFSSSTSGDILNFCNSRTQTFANVNVNTAGRVNSTSSNISIVGEPNSTFAYSSLYSADIVNLSGTINVGPTVADGRNYLLSVYATTTLTATSLTVNARGSSGSLQTVDLDFYSYGNFATSVGAINYAAFAVGTIKVDTVGSLTFGSSAGHTLRGSDGSSFVPQVTGTTTLNANAWLTYNMPRNFVGAVSLADGARMTSNGGSGSSVFSSTLTIGAGCEFQMQGGDYTFNGAVTTNGTQALPSSFTFAFGGNPITFNASSTFNYTPVNLTTDVTVNAPIAFNSSIFSSNNVLLNAALTVSNLATGDTAGLSIAGALTSNASGTVSMTAATGTFISSSVGYANLAASFAVSQGASGNATLNFSNYGVVTTSTFTVSCTGSGYAIMNLDLFSPSSFNSLSLTNTALAAGAISVTGGVGRSFVYNVTAACPVGVTFDCTSLTVTTPTCSITGVVSRRVDMTGGAVSITGSTPTLSHVSFYQTTINNGLSAFTGTRLGTDGLSSGFVAQTPAQKFLVLGGATAQINTAVWALTSGGATSVNNYPLPQDSVVIDTSSGGGVLEFTNATAYLGSISQVAGSDTVSFNLSVSLYGNYINYASTSSFNILNIMRSGISARTITIDGPYNYIYTQLGVHLAPTDSLNFIGSNSAAFDCFNNVIFTSGSITLSPTVTFKVQNVFYTAPNNANDLNVDGSTTISTSDLIWGPVTNVSTTNYTVNLYNDGVYVNNATATARNGSVVAIGNSAFITSNSTTATNPIVELRFQNTSPSVATTITLNGNTFVQNLTSGNSTLSETARLVGAAGRTITKTNGGTVGVTALRVTNVRASPANTFYAVGPNSTLAGDTAGWNLGTPPTTSSGGFLLF